MVLADDDSAAIVAAITSGRQVLDNVHISARAVPEGVPLAAVRTSPSAPARLAVVAPLPFVVWGADEIVRRVRGCARVPR